MSIFGDFNLESSLISVWFHLICAALDMLRSPQSIPWEISALIWGPLPRGWLLHMQYIVQELKKKIKEKNKKKKYNLDSLCEWCSMFWSCRVRNIQSDNNSSIQIKKDRLYQGSHVVRGVVNVFLKSLILGRCQQIVGREKQTALVWLEKYLLKINLRQ